MTNRNASMDPSGAAPAEQAPRAETRAASGGREAANQERMPGTGQKARPAPAFNPMRYFLVGSLVLFVLATLFMTYYYRNAARDALVETKEIANVDLARVLTNDLLFDKGRPESRANLLSLRELVLQSPRQALESEVFRHQDATVRALLAGTHFYKFKVYDPQGLTVYSTESDQIGVGASRNAGVIAAQHGELSSELVHRDTFSAMEGQVMNLDLVQSYVPAQIEKGGERWVFEVYVDASEELADMRRQNMFKLFGLFLVMAVAFGINYAIMTRVNRMMKAQSDERAAAFAQLRASEVQLSREKAAFLSAAAHELRTPMTGILGFSELLHTRPMDGASVRKMAGTIRGQAVSMSALLNDLLQVTLLDEKMERGLHRERLSLRLTVEAAVANISRPGLNRLIETRFAPNLPDLQLDREKFQRVLVNLLSNACKYSGPGTRVEVSAFQSNRGGEEMVGIRVSDKGIGMTREEVSQVFERFWRAEGAMAVQGSGLGMAIVKAIVTLHGGTIDVDSVPGMGTQVTIWLPVKAPAAVQQAKETAT
jgi:signal transduction histidine kinase